MAGAALEFRFDDQELRDMLARAASIGGSDVLHPAWDAIGEAMVSKTQQRFQQQKGPDGTPWKPSRAAIKEGRKTLIDTARLVGSMVHNVTANGVEWGTNVPYAAVHQFGATFSIFARSQQIYRRIDKHGELGTQFVKKKKSNFASWVTIGAHEVTIPARPFLGIDRDDIDEAKTMLTVALQQYLTGKRTS